MVELARGIADDRGKVNDRVGTMRRGHKVREVASIAVDELEVARALVVKPDILFMDEPFGSLDALTRLKLRAELLRVLSVERHTVILRREGDQVAVARLRF